MRWFRGPLRERVRNAVLGGELAGTGFFEHRYLEHLIDAHASGRRDYSGPLWSLMMFEAFLRQNGSDSSAERAPLMAEAVAG